jgi:hypothetical protein
MPMIFRAVCNECGYKSAGTDRALAVIASDIPPQYQHPTNPELACLPHPGGRPALEALHTTLSTASREGRVIRLRGVVCKRCGTIYDLQSLTHSETFAGCLGALAAAILAGVVGGLLMRHWLAGLIVFWIAGLLAAAALEDIPLRLLRWRYPERARKYNGTNPCPACGAQTPRRLARINGLPCPACRRETLQVRHSGIS